MLQNFVRANGGSFRPDGVERVLREGQWSVRVSREGWRVGAHAARAGARAHGADQPARARAHAWLARAVPGGQGTKPLLL